MPDTVAAERIAVEFGFLVREPEAQPELGGRRPPSSPPAVAAVLRGSRAEQAGLQAGDVLVEVNGRPVVTLDAVAGRAARRVARLRARRWSYGATTRASPCWCPLREVAVSKDATGATVRSPPRGPPTSEAGEELRRHLPLARGPRGGAAEEARSEEEERGRHRNLVAACCVGVAISTRRIVTSSRFSCPSRVNATPLARSTQESSPFT